MMWCSDVNALGAALRAAGRASRGHALRARRPGKERGGVTIFTGILVLILLTGLLVYAARVGITEQRISANELRYKQAFTAAESGTEHAREWLLANQILLSSAEEDLLPDGSDGWLSASGGRWRKCSDYTADFDSSTDATERAHPCRGEPSAVRRANSYFFYWDDPLVADDDPYELKLATNEFLEDAERVTVRALLCLLTVDFEAATPVSGCDASAAVGSSTHYMITLLARGESDCSGNTCLGEALVSVPLANSTLLGGDPPDVPLTAASTLEGTGTSQVAANPNAGGLGVPLSVWANANPSCAPSSAILSKGNWSTCELQEWYGQDFMPEDLRCPTSSCSCSAREALSYTSGSTLIQGLDLWVDENFPCDLIQFFFGVPKSRYHMMRSGAKLLSSCDSLGPDSYGIYWVTGPDCTIQNQVIGSPKAPVVLLSAASTTWLNGNAELYGVLFISNVEDSAATLKSAGTNIFYGAVIVDTTVDNFAGTFQVVYNEGILARVAGYGGLEKLPGGWTDSPLDWH
jgi:hypothetical protein